MNKVQREKIASQCLFQCSVEVGGESISVELRFLRCQVSACRTTNEWTNVNCWWTEMTAENRSALKETCPGSNLTTRNPARMYLWLIQCLRSDKPANNCLRYSTTATSVCIKRPIFFVSYLILGLETSIDVWLRIHFFLDKIILKFPRRNLSCLNKFLSNSVLSLFYFIRSKCVMLLTFPCTRDIRA